jgi:hypothetical protein
MLITMAYFGGPAAWRSLLQGTTPAALRAELAGPGLAGGQLHDTMNWRSIGNTQDLGQGGQASSYAPTDAQIIAAVNDPKWFTHDITRYLHILAMLTHLEEGQNKPWIDAGTYDGAGPSTGKPVLIARGWGGNGLDANGAPTASGGVQGILDASLPNPPGTGLTGAPLEIFSAVDAEGRRSAPHYCIEGMRPLVAAWLTLWVYGFIDLTDPDIVTALPIMDRGVRFMAHADKGWASWEHGRSSGRWPVSNQNWQRHVDGGAFDGPQGGNLYTLWTDCLGPAMGCGQVVRNGGFAGAAGWTGFGANGKAVSGGKAVFGGTPAASPIAQPVPLVPGKYYQVQFTLAGYSAGNPFPFLGGGMQRNGAQRTANGTYRERLLVNAGNNAFGLQGASGAQSYTVDDVSLTGPFETATVDGN